MTSIHQWEQHEQQKLVVAFCTVLRSLADQVGYGSKKIHKKLVSAHGRSKVWLIKAATTGKENWVIFILLKIAYNNNTGQNVRLFNHLAFKEMDHHIPSFARWLWQTKLYGNSELYREQTQTASLFYVHYIYFIMIHWTENLSMASLSQNDQI